MFCIDWRSCPTGSVALNWLIRWLYVAPAATLTKLYLVLKSVTLSDAASSFRGSAQFVVVLGSAMYFRQPAVPPVPTACTIGGVRNGEPRRALAMMHRKRWERQH